MSIAQQPVRVAIIGCGEVTCFKHLPALAEVKEVSVVALCDLKAQAASDAAKMFGVAKHCSDAREIFAMPEVEGVGVCTEPGSHTELAIAAMRAGKHVLVEKPLALTTEECRQMIAGAEAAGVVAMTGLHMRFHRLIREARDLIRQGVLGPIESIRLVWQSPRSDVDIPHWKTHRQFGGGALTEIAVHHFDLVRFLLDTEFEEVQAIGRDGLREDETAVVIARLANQTLVSAEFSERSPHEIEIVISGRKNVLRINCQRFDGLEMRELRDLPGKPSVRLRSVARFFNTLPFGVTTIRRGGDYRMSYENEWRHFAECVRKGRAPECTFQDGLRSVEVVRASTQSVSTSERIAISRS